MQLSENAARVVGRELPALLEASIQSVVPKNVLQSILAELSAGVRSTARKVTLGNDPGRAFDAVAHRQGESLIVELEPLDPRAVSEIDDIFDAVRSYAGSLQDARTVADVAKLVIGQIAGLTDFDRVMVYRFDRDWCGEVIAERVADGLPPFLGLHYPESDIPSQARDLYRRNALRFIPDVEYQPARIVPELDPLNGRPWT